MNPSLLKISPNPNSGFFQIAMKNLNGQAREISICDLVGKQVFHSKENNTSNNAITQDIDLSASPKGIYIVQVKDAQSVYVSKVVLQ